MLRSILIATLLITSFASCMEEDMACDDNVSINEGTYITGVSDEVSLLDIVIVDQCMEVSFSASGCDGESWDVSLVDSEQVAESFPVQRFMRLILENNEECEAVINKTVSFNLEPIQIGSDSSILINIDGWPIKVKYDY